MDTVHDAVQSQVLNDQAHSITIKAPLEGVWGEITRRQGIQQPMFNTVLEATFDRGGRLLYRSKDGKRVFIIGEVVEFQPPKRLAHTFRFTTIDEDPTLVTWDLSETAEGVRATVTHTHFSNQAVTHKNADTGWPAILAGYKSVLKSGSVPFRTRIKHRLMQAFAFMMPSGTRTEAATRLATSLATLRAGQGDARTRS